eukprot:Phypoly_transcript_10917.p1 GENE.Phypoly_transcript_10917~~Phypoly_transcript_10917.p1  ORF type:complete len:363 (+),score=77.23 Phypoly_transcript_10917:133-1221(+)
MADNNTARRLSSIVNIDLLDPILEAMLDGVLLPGSNANVSVEFNFMPFLVDERDMDHHWHPGPMDVDYLDDDGEDKDEDDEGEILYGDGEEDYGEGVEEDIEREGDEEEEEDGGRYDYSSQRDYDEAELLEEDEGEGEDAGEDEEERDEEDGYDEGDEEVDEDEDEDEEDEEYVRGFIDDSVLANYGSLGWSICHNISDRKILNDSFNSRDFLRQMVEFFFTHLKQSTLSSTTSLHLLLNCLPSLMDLKLLISKKKYTMKEALVIKVVLEMYESYYRTFGAPNFKIYHAEVVPLLLDFYNRLPDSVLKLMSKQLTRVLLNLSSLTSHFKFYQTQKEFIAHYHETTRRMRNLSECTDPALFIR